jgi:hypothetical protein
MLYEGGLKKLTTTRYPVYPVMSYSVSRTGYIVGYVVRGETPLVICNDDYDYDYEYDHDHDYDYAYAYDYDYDL